MVTPMFPSLMPKFVDSNWFSIDRPIDEDQLLTQMEKEHQQAINEIVQRDSDYIAPGNMEYNQEEEEEEEEEDDNNDDEDSVVGDEDDDDDEDMVMDDTGSHSHWVPQSPMFNHASIWLEEDGEEDNNVEEEEEESS